MPTTYEPAEVPAWPVYAFAVQDNDQVAVSGPLLPAAQHPTRASAVDAVASAATRLGRPVRAEATEPDGAVWHLVISSDGAVSELSGAQRGKAPKKRNAAPAAGAPVTGPPHLPVAAPNMDQARNVPVDEPSPHAHAPAQGPPTHPGALGEALSLLDAHAAAGRMDQALALAAQLDEYAADTLGFSHPEALRVHESRARVTALAGDPVAGVRMYRDVAERWHYRGAVEQAEAVADRAHALWLETPGLEAAISAGVDMVRMRNQIPGAGGSAFAAVVEHQTRLEAARNAAGQPGTRTVPI